MFTQISTGGEVPLSMNVSIVESYRMHLPFLFSILDVIGGSRIHKALLGEIEEAHLNYQADDVPDFFRA